MKDLGEKMKKKAFYIISFSLLLLFAVFLRVYNIATTPLQMHGDGAGLGVNAWSIANYGTDRYGNFMPVCPSNFYGEQSAFYTYFCALLVKLFGLNIYTLRMPGVIMGIITVIFGSLLMKEKWGNKGLFTGLALLGIFPYFIMNCRFALDCNAMLGTLTVALYCLVRLLKKIEKEPTKKYYWYFTLTGVLFGIVLYTYIIAAIVIAIFCVLFGIYYLFYQKENRGLRFKQLLCFALPLGVMVIPLVLVVCVNYFDWEPIETAFFSVPKMMVDRTEEVSFSLSALPGKIKSLLNVFTSDGKYGSSDTYWTMYLWSPLLIIIGGIFSMVKAFKKIKLRSLSIDLCMLFIAFAEVVMFILCGQLIYHINGIFIALAYFCLSGIFAIMSLLKKKPLRIGFSVILTCLYTVSFLGFAKEYYFADTTVAFQVYGGTDEALSLLSEEQQKKDIYFLDEVDVYYFLINPIPPSEFASHSDEMGYVKDYKNLHFYKPESFEGGHVYVCNKASGYYNLLTDIEITGIPYEYKETEHYYVFYPQ